MGNVMGGETFLGGGGWKASRIRVDRCLARGKGVAVEWLAAHLRHARILIWLWHVHARDGCVRFY